MSSLLPIFLEKIICCEIFLKKMSSLLPVMFAQNIKLPNTLLLHSFTGLKVGACRYILQKMKIHFQQYPKEYLILCV